MLLLEREQYVINKLKLHKFRLQNLHYNPQESYVKSLRCITGENQSVATKNRTILHTFSTTRDLIDVQYLALISLNFRERLTE